MRVAATLGLLLGLVLVAPIDQAQPAQPVVSIHFLNVPESHEPRGPPATIVVEARIQCDGPEPTQVTFQRSKAPSYASVDFFPATWRSSGGAACVPGSTIYARSNMTISLSNRAPAFEDGLYEVSVRVTRAPTTYGPYLGTFSIKNGLYYDLAVDERSFTAFARPGTVSHITVSVENRGNSPVVVNITPAPGWHANFSQIETGSRKHLTAPGLGAGRENTYVVIRATLAGHVNSGKQYTFKVLFNATYDGIAPDPPGWAIQERSFAVEAEGFFADAVPALGTLAAVGVAGLLWRRRPLT